MYALEDGTYREMPESISLPGLNVQMITAFIEDAKTHGQTKALAAFKKALAPKGLAGKKH